MPDCSFYHLNPWETRKSERASEKVRVGGKRGMVDNTWKSNFEVTHFFFLLFAHHQIFFTIKNICKLWSFDFLFDFFYFLTPLHKPKSIIQGKSLIINNETILHFYIFIKTLFSMIIKLFFMWKHLAGPNIWDDFRFYLVRTFGLHNVCKTWPHRHA